MGPPDNTTESLLGASAAAHLAPMLQLVVKRRPPTRMAHTPMKPTRHTPRSSPVPFVTADSSKSWGTGQQLMCRHYGVTQLPSPPPPPTHTQHTPTDQGSKPMVACAWPLNAATTPQAAVLLSCPLEERVHAAHLQLPQASQPHAPAGEGRTPHEAGHTSQHANCQQSLWSNATTVNSRHTLAHTSARSAFEWNGKCG